MRCCKQIEGSWDWTCVANWDSQLHRGIVRHLRVIGERGNDRVIPYLAEQLDLQGNSNRLNPTTCIDEVGEAMG